MSYRESSSSVTLSKFNNQYDAWFFPYWLLFSDNGFAYLYLDALNGDCSSLKKT